MSKPLILGGGTEALLVGLLVVVGAVVREQALVLDGERMGEPHRRGTEP